MSSESKVAIVTGAGSGVGKAAVLAMMAQRMATKMPFAGRG